MVQFYVNFNDEYTLGDNLFTVDAARWSSFYGTNTPTIVTDGARNVLSLEAGGDAAMQFIPAGSPTDFELLTLVRKVTTFPNTTVAGRLAGTGTANMSFLGGNLRNNITHARVYQYVSGGATDIIVAHGLNHLGWVWIRFRVDGDQRRLRMWQEGDEEPSTWLIDNSAGAGPSAAGPLGLVHRASPGQIANVVMFSVGTDGDTAPMEAPATGPTIPIENDWVSQGLILQGDDLIAGGLVGHIPFHNGSIVEFDNYLWMYYVAGEGVDGGNGVLYRGLYARRCSLALDIRNLANWEDVNNGNPLYTYNPAGGANLREGTISISTVVVDNTMHMLMGVCVQDGASSTLVDIGIRHLTTTDGISLTDNGWTLPPTGAGIAGDSQREFYAETIWYDGSNYHMIYVGEEPASQYNLYKITGTAPNNWTTGSSALLFANKDLADVIPLGDGTALLFYGEQDNGHAVRTFDVTDPAALSSGTDAETYSITLTKVYAFFYCRPDTNDFIMVRNETNPSATGSDLALYTSGSWATGPTITNVTDGVDSIFTVGQIGVLILGTGFGTQ